MTIGAPGFIFTDGVISTINMGSKTQGPAVYHLKECLKQASWTHIASSDGATFSNSVGNANDKTTSESAFSSNGSYIVLQEPACPHGAGYPGNRQIIFRRGTVSDATWTIAYVPANTDGSFQSPTSPGNAVIPPTYSTFNLLLGTAMTTGSAWTGGAAGTYACGAMNVAPYAFFLVGWGADGNPGEQGGGIAFDPLVPGSYDPADIDPVVWYVGDSNDSFTATGTGGGLDALLGGGNSPGPSCYVRRGLPGEKYVRVALLTYCAGASGIVEVLPGGIGPSPYGSQFQDSPLPAFWGAGGDSVTVTSRYPHFIKGESFLMRWKTSTWCPGTMITRVYANDRIVIGDVTLPHDGVTPYNVR